MFRPASSGISHSIYKPASSGRVSDVADGLIGHWSPTLDGNAGSDTIEDRSGNFNDAVLVSTVVVENSEAYGGTHAVESDGDTWDQGLGIPNANGWYDDIRTVSYWGRIDRASVQTIWAFADSTGSGQPGHDNITNSLTDWRVYRRSDGLRSISQSMALTVGQWHHVVWTTDDSSSQFYVDAVPMDMGAFANPIPNLLPITQDFIYFIQHPDRRSLPYDGTMDSIRLYDRAITQPEVTELFNAGRNEEGLGPGPGPSAPENVVPPLVTGDAVVGENVTTTDGTWDGEEPITYTYQWQSNQNDIPGAVQNNFTIGGAYVGQMIRCVVTAKNAHGEASEPSNEIGPVTSQPPPDEGATFLLLPM